MTSLLLYLTSLSRVPIIAIERIEKAKLDWEEKKWEKEHKARQATGRLQLVTMAMEKGMSSEETKEFLKLTEKGLEDENEDQ